MGIGTSKLKYGRELGPDWTAATDSATTALRHLPRLAGTFGFCMTVTLIQFLQLAWPGSWLFWILGAAARVVAFFMSLVFGVIRMILTGNSTLAQNSVDVFGSTSGYIYCPTVVGVWVAVIAYRIASRSQIPRDKAQPIVNALIAGLIVTCLIPFHAVISWFVGIVELMIKLWG